MLLQITHRYIPNTDWPNRLLQTWRSVPKWMWFAVTCRKTIWKSSATRLRMRSTLAKTWWETGRCAWPCGSWPWPHFWATWLFCSCYSAVGSGWPYPSSSCATWQWPTFAWASTCCSSPLWTPGQSDTTSITPYSGKEVTW